MMSETPSSTLPVELPDSMYQLLIRYSAEYQWVRIAYLRERLHGQGGGFVESIMSQIICWTDGRCGVVKKIKIPAKDDYLFAIELVKLFEDRPWTRILIKADIDGTRSARLTVDPDDETVVDYLSGRSDPFWSELDEHRAELDALGRRFYG